MKIQPTESNHSTDNDILHPKDIEDRHPYDVVAQYRRLLGKSANFKTEPLRTGKDETETVILGLSNVASKSNRKQIDLSFKQRKDKSIC